ELIATTDYDVVVTDLRMPAVNGHTLALELLNRPARPVVVVLTGVTEPKLAKDLIARGVDDIIFKPVDQSILAAKVRALVDRRATWRPDEPLSDAPAIQSDYVAPAIASRAPVQDSGVVGGESDPSKRVKPALNPDDLANVMELIRLGKVSNRQLAEVIERIPPLAAEVFRVANGRLYNRTRKKVVDLEDALVRLGQVSTRNIALAMITSRA
ncbi:MAG TPA: response regulator, partial [Planctomycetaceae bacterium]